MASTVEPVLAVCGGGDDALAWIVGVGVGAAYLIALAAAVLRGADDSERRIGAVLLLGSIAVGALATFGGAALLGGDQLGAFVLSLLLCGGVAIAVAARSREEIVGRLVLVAVGGAFLVPGGYLLLIVTAFGIGGACLE